MSFSAKAKEEECDITTHHIFILVTSATVAVPFRTSGEARFLSEAATAKADRLGFDP
jgi:hypothetical protein